MLPMKLATWNVNSITARLPHLQRWLAGARPDVLALQELKCPVEKFPAQAIAELGYTAAVHGQKTYNGVALLVRAGLPWREVARGVPEFDDEQARLVVAELDEPGSEAPLIVASAYFPNGQAVGSDKFAYKLGWIDALASWIERERLAERPFVLMGDFNIAPAPEDTHPDWPQDGILASPPERAAFARLLSLGLVDAFRRFPQPPQSYSWWDYRQGAFRRNLGLRIDHILVSPAVLPRLRACTIDVEPRRWERPSDHAPVVLELAPMEQFNAMAQRAII